MVERRSLTLRDIVLVLSLVCFVLAFFGASLDGRSLVDLGLALMALGLLL